MPCPFLMDRKDLLKAVEALHRNANRKVSRNKSKGVVIAGSAVDPRRDMKKVRKYNTKQLQSYANSLKKFNSRSSQFVAGLFGEPISKQKYDAYKRKEQARNESVRRYLKATEDLPVAGRKGMTVGQRRKDRAGLTGYTVNPAVNGMNLTERTPSNMTNKGLDKFLKSFNKTPAHKFMKSEVAKYRSQLRAMFDKIGDDELNSYVDSLSDNAFLYLFNDTNFVSATSLKYETLLAIDARGHKSYHDTLLKDATQEMSDIVYSMPQIK